MLPTLEFKKQNKAEVELFSESGFPTRLCELSGQGQAVLAQGRHQKSAHGGKGEKEGGRERRFS